MKLIALPRGGGKTKTLLDWLRENPNGVVIVPTFIQSRSLSESYPECKDRIFPADQISHLRGRPDLKIAVDDIDQVLAALYGFTISIGTLTPEET